MVRFAHFRNKKMGIKVCCYSRNTKFHIVFHLGRRFKSGQFTLKIVFFYNNDLSRWFVIKQPIIITACYCVHLRQHGIFFRECLIQISNSSSLKSMIFRLLTCTYRTNKFYIYWWQFFINLSEMWTWDWIGTLACADLFSTDIFWILNYRNQREKKLN
jgi:hypothetical protein